MLYLILATAERYTLDAEACFVLLWMPPFALRCRDYCVKQHRSSKTWEKLFHFSPWTQRGRGVSVQIISPSRAGRGMTCNTPGLGASVSSVGPTNGFGKPHSCTAGTQRYSRCSSSSFNSQPRWGWTREAERGERFVHRFLPSVQREGE